MTKKILKKAAIFTDLHVGAKNGSVMHNEDCMDYAKWFCDNVKNDKTIDHIIDCGDFFDDRAKLSTLTLDYGYRISEMIDKLKLPFFRLIGNHSLFHRNNRKVHNMIEMGSLPNTTLINDITIIDDLGEHGSVLSPFLFPEEYTQLHQYTKYPYLYIHGEFNGFVMTGENYLCEHGADPDHYDYFTRIMSGHFHKRGHGKNVDYIGNCFPLTYADANDSSRGMATFEYKTNNLQFIDWKECPTYTYLKLSQLYNNPKLANKPKGSFKIYVDIDFEQNDILTMRETFMKKYNLREMSFEESKQLDFDGDTSLDENDELESTKDIIKNKLLTVTMDGIDSEYLVELYEDLYATK